MVDEQINSKLAVFQGKHIRRILHNEEWWFSVIDIIEVLTDSSIPKRYWSDLKSKLISEGFAETYEKIVRLKMTSPDGKKRFTDCANTETMFRIIQSIPSPKVEPLKRWLARVGKERIGEIENPELAMERMKELYARKGYPKGLNRSGRTHRTAVVWQEGRERISSLIPENQWCQERILRN